MGNVHRLSQRRLMKATRHCKVETGKQIVSFKTEPHSGHNNRIHNSFSSMAQVPNLGNIPAILGCQTLFIRKQRGDPIQQRLMSQESPINREELYKKWKSGIDTDFLTPNMLKVHNAHEIAIKAKLESYCDPVTDLEVLTIITHLSRGYCCGNVCRHCPYQHAGVAPHFKDLMKFNTCFYQ